MMALWWNVRRFTIEKISRHSTNRRRGGGRHFIQIYFQQIKTAMNDEPDGAPVDGFHSKCHVGAMICTRLADVPLSPHPTERGMFQSKGFHDCTVNVWTQGQRGYRQKRGQAGAVPCLPLEHISSGTHLMEGNFRLITEVSSGGGTFPFFRRVAPLIAKEESEIVNSLNHAL